MRYYIGYFMLLDLQRAPNRMHMGMFKICLTGGCPLFGKEVVTPHCPQCGQKIGTVEREYPIDKTSILADCLVEVESQYSIDPKDREPFAGGKIVVEANGAVEERFLLYTQVEHLGAKFHFADFLVAGDIAPEKDEMHRVWTELGYVFLREGIPYELKYGIISPNDYHRRSDF
jgi:hypothetical protein